MTTAKDAGATFEHNIGPRGRLTIRLASAEMRLRAGQDDRVIIRTPDGRAFPDRLIIEPVDGGLTVREKEAVGLTFGIGRRTVQLDIQLPPEAGLELSTASGWVESDGLHGEQRFKTVSGEVHIRGGAGMIDVAAVSGDATIDLEGAASLAVRSVSGEVAVRGGRIDVLRIATTSGDIRFDSELSQTADHSIETLSGDVELAVDGGIRVDARTVSGDLATDLPHRTEGRMGSRTLIVGDGATHLSFRSVSGDLRVRDRSGAGSRQSSGGRPAGPALPSMPTLPAPPAPPRAPSLPPAPGRAPESTRAAEPTPVTESASTPESSSPADEERMTILRALERGELDVAAALTRLAELDPETELDAEAEHDPEGTNA